MTKLLRSPEFTLVASALILAGLTALAYTRLGFLGVALVGLFLLFMAVQSDLQKEGAHRPFLAEQLSQTERMARESEGSTMARFWRLAATAGAALTAVGLAGFGYLQLPK